MSHPDIVELIEDYLSKVKSTTLEQAIMSQALREIVGLRKERDHLMRQLINMGETSNAENTK